MNNDSITGFNDDNEPREYRAAGDDDAVHETPEQPKTTSASTRDATRLRAMLRRSEYDIPMADMRSPIPSAAGSVLDTAAEPAHAHAAASLREPARATIPFPDQLTLSGAHDHADDAPVQTGHRSVQPTMLRSIPSTAATQREQPKKINLAVAGRHDYAMHAIESPAHAAAVVAAQDDPWVDPSPTIELSEPAMPVIESAGPPRSHEPADEPEPVTAARSYEPPTVVPAAFEPREYHAPRARAFDEDPMPTPRTAEPQYTPRSSSQERARPSRSGNLLRTIAVGATLCIGVGLGIGLYAGGGDLLSGIFGHSRENIPPQNPAAVTERPNYAPSTAASSLDANTQGASAQQMQSAPQPSSVAPEGATGNDPTAPQTSVAEESGSVPQAAASSRTAEPRVIDVEEPPKPRATVAAEPRKTRPVDEAKPARSYSVQVRATSDESEAKRILRTLKSKGFSGVSIVSSGAEGARTYRVRFGSYKSQDEAKVAAGRAGYDKTWVISQTKKGTAASKSVEAKRPAAPKSTTDARQQSTAKSASTAKPVTSAKPGATAKPATDTKSASATKPASSTKSASTSKPAASTKPAGSTAKSTSDVKSASSTKPASSSKPALSAKPVASGRSTTGTKPATAAKRQVDVKRPAGPKRSPDQDR